jgi:hypothetical protein
MLKGVAFSSIVMVILIHILGSNNIRSALFLEFYIHIFQLLL